MARPPKLANASLEALTAEIHRRRRALPKLEARARDLRDQLAEVEAEIAALGGAAGGGRGGRRGGGRAGRGRAGGGRAGRGRGGSNLAADVAKVLGDKPLGPKQIADAIVSAKLRPATKTLAIQVSQVLSKNKSMFSKQGRGQWVKKG